eukprot:SAG22_NODE_1586_length_4055_cov_5.508342_2_plen_568_part_00
MGIDMDGWAQYFGEQPDLYQAQFYLWRQLHASRSEEDVVREWTNNQALQRTEWRGLLSRMTDALVAVGVCHRHSMVIDWIDDDAIETRNQWLPRAVAAYNDTDPPAAAPPPAPEAPAPARRAGNYLVHSEEQALTWLAGSPGTYSALYVPFLHAVWNTGQLQPQIAIWRRIFGAQQIDWDDFVQRYRQLHNVRESGTGLPTYANGYVHATIQGNLIGIDVQTPGLQQDFMAAVLHLQQTAQQPPVLPPVMNPHAPEHISCSEASILLDMPIYPEGDDEHWQEVRDALSDHFGFCISSLEVRNGVRYGNVIHIAWDLDLGSDVSSDEEQAARWDFNINSSDDTEESSDEEQAARARNSSCAVAQRAQIDGPRLSPTEATRIAEAFRARTQPAAPPSYAAATGAAAAAEDEQPPAEPAAAATAPEPPAALLAVGGFLSEIERYAPGAAPAPPSSDSDSGTESPRPGTYMPAAAAEAEAEAAPDPPSLIAQQNAEYEAALAADLAAQAAEQEQQQQPSPRTAAAPTPNPRAAAAAAAEARELECLHAEIDALMEELAEPTARLDGFAFID